jgi:hypothetical protein
MRHQRSVEKRKTPWRRNEIDVATRVPVKKGHAEEIKENTEVTPGMLDP